MRWRSLTIVVALAFGGPAVTTHAAEPTPDVHAMSLRSADVPSGMKLVKHLASTGYEARAYAGRGMLGAVRVAGVFEQVGLAASADAVRRLGARWADALVDPARRRAVARSRVRITRGHAASVRTTRFRDPGIGTWSYSLVFTVSAHRHYQRVLWTMAGVGRAWYEVMVVGDADQAADPADVRPLLVTAAQRAGEPQGLEPAEIALPATP